MKKFIHYMPLTTAVLCGLQVLILAATMGSNGAMAIMGWCLAFCAWGIVAYLQPPWTNPK